MPTLRDYRGRSNDPGMQLANDLGQSALALLQFLVERGDDKLQKQILEQNLTLSRESSDLNRQALSRGQVELQRSLEELVGLKASRAVASEQETVVARVAGRQETDLTMSQRTRQTREAMEGTFDPTVATERDGSVYGPAIDYADAKAMLGQEQVAPGGQRVVGLSKDNLRDERSRLFQRYIRDVENHARDVRDSEREQQAATRRKDPDAARDDKQINDSVNRIVKRAFDAVVVADIDFGVADAEAEAINLLLLESENEEDSPLAGVASQLLSSPDKRAAYEESREEIVRQRDIATGGGLASFLSTEYGMDVPEDIGERAKSDDERQLLGMLRSGEIEGDRGRMAARILSGEEVDVQASKHSKDRELHSFMVSVGDEDVGEYTAAELGGRGLFGGAGRVVRDSDARDFLLRRLLEPAAESATSDLPEPSAPAGMVESLRARSGDEDGAPGATPEASGEMRGLVDMVGDAAKNAAFQAGLTAGVQSALEMLMGVSGGPAAQGAPAPIPGTAPAPQSALPSGIMGPAMRGLGAAQAAGSRRAAPSPPPGLPRRASPQDLQLLQLLGLGMPPMVP